jgi:hypothetical protein
MCLFYSTERHGACLGRTVEEHQRHGIARAESRTTTRHGACRDMELALPEQSRNTTLSHKDFRNTTLQLSHHIDW